eukprot:361901-Pleurochrysis_carterae.AAC.1
MQAAVQQQARSLHATEANSATMSRAAAEAADLAASLNSAGEARALSSNGAPNITPAEATAAAAAAATALASFQQAQRSSLENPAEEPPPATREEELAEMARLTEASMEFRFINALQTLLDHWTFLTNKSTDCTGQ